MAKNKVFVVPQEIGEGKFYDYENKVPVCAVGHLAHHFEIPQKGGVVSDLLFSGLGHDLMGASLLSLNELSVSNDKLNTNEERRTNMINWLREYFPNNEVT